MNSVSTQNIPNDGAMLVSSINDSPSDGLKDICECVASKCVCVQRRLCLFDVQFSRPLSQDYNKRQTLCQKFPF